VVVITSEVVGVVVVTLKSVVSTDEVVVT